MEAEPEQEKTADGMYKAVASLYEIATGGTNRCEYMGDFSVERWSEEESEIREHERRSARNDVARVIYLRGEVG